VIHHLTGNLEPSWAGRWLAGQCDASRHKFFGNRVATLAASVLFCREFANVSVGVDRELHLGHSRKKKETCAGFVPSKKKTSQSRETKINRESSV
jgi:hypothetical protein